MSVDKEPGARLTYALALVQVNVVATFVAVASPVLQTRAPTIYWFGPTLTLFESRPITPHEMGVIFNTGAPSTGRAGDANIVASVVSSAVAASAREGILCCLIFI
jgi:hypothetical protein